MAFNPVCFYYLWQSYHLIHSISQSIFFFLHYPFEYSRIIALIFTSTHCAFKQIKDQATIF